MKKQTGYNRNKSIFRRLCYCLEPWLDRWFIFSSEGIGYIVNNKWEIKYFREFSYFSKNF